MQQITVEDIVEVMKSRYIENIAYSIAGPNNVDDVIQEATINSWKHLDRFRKDSSLHSYMCSIVRNIAINLIRSKKENQNKVNIDDEFLYKNYIISYDIDRKIHNNNIVNLINDAITTVCNYLSQHEKYLIIERYGKNRKLGEIAKEFGIYQSTITRQIEKTFKKIKHRIRLNLLVKGLSDDVIDDCLINMQTNIQVDLIDILKKGMDS